MSLRDIVAGLRRGALLAVITALVAGGIAFVVTKRMDPVYEVTASLLATMAPPTFGNVELIRPPAIDVRVYQRVLLDSSLMRDALQRLDGVPRDDAFMRAFRRRISVRVENQEVSSILHIDVRGPDPTQAATYANLFASALIDWDRNRTSQMVSNSISALERSIAALDSEISAAVARGDDMSLQALTATLREQRVRELEALRARSTSAVIVGLLETLSVAEPPMEAIGPRLVFNTFVAIVLGLVFGYGAQFALWSIRNGVTTRSQLMDLVRLPILATMTSPRRGSHRLDQDSVSFFRTNLLRAVPPAPKIVIGITSATSYAEKTGLAVSLAESLANTGRRTLLIDADLRMSGPGLGLKLEGANGPTLSALLHSFEMPTQFLNVINDFGGSFDVLPTLAPARYPNELIAFGFGQLTARLGEAYDVIVVDLPPVLSYADALTAAPFCSGLVLAVGIGTDRTKVSDAAALLDNNSVTVLGAVLTGAEASAGSEKSNGKRGARTSTRATAAATRPAEARPKARVTRR